MSDWIEWRWTPEKPYPEIFETKVLVRYADGCETKRPLTVGSWIISAPKRSGWHPSRGQYRITHYRVVEAA